MGIIVHTAMKQMPTPDPTHTNPREKCRNWAKKFSEKFEQFSPDGFRQQKWRNGNFKRINIDKSICEGVFSNKEGDSQ